jgi:serine/threonine-protein kinase
VSLEHPIGELLLGRYRAIEKIATGGYSTVYRGLDERLARPVCIKVFNQVTTGRAWRTAYEHFIQEAFALSTLTHPNTLRIYDFGHLGPHGDAVQVFEFMNGGHLGHLIGRDGPLPIPEAYRLISLLADALTEAHSHQLVHRDIKPSNILVGRCAGSNEPKLADFGIAKSLVGATVANRTDTRVTAGNTLMYSARWAAPEQLVGLDVSPASDVYSLALVAISMLTGRVVLSARQPEEGLEERRSVADLIEAALRPDMVSETAIDVLKRACTFDPGHRLSSIERFAAELGEAFAEPAFSKRREPTVRSSQSSIGTANTEQLHNRKPRLALGPGAVELVAGKSYEVLELDHDSKTLRLGNERVLVTFMPAAPGGRTIHVKGINCFVAKPGGRPSSAVVLTGDGVIDLVDPRNRLLARVNLRFGAESRQSVLFELPDDVVAALPRGECPNAILIDCPEGPRSFFLHGPSGSSAQ